MRLPLPADEAVANRAPPVSHQYPSSTPATGEVRFHPVDTANLGEPGGSLAAKETQCKDPFVSATPAHESAKADLPP